MPPTSSVRKTALPDNQAAGAKRTASGRAIRTNTTRPANYYARPFGSLSAASATNADQDAQDAASPGFTPALTYFTTAITALPKEVMKQFTQMKEVEAKVHGPHEQLGEAIDAVLELPIPPRKSTNGQAVAGGHQQGLLSLTTNNSMSGSANASLVNGVAGGVQHSAQNSISGSVAPEDPAQYETEEEMRRRKQYYDVRALTHSLLPLLDEKSVVLNEAERILSLQESRIDSVLPHIDGEISEVSRLGSMTHWAYSDNRQKKGAATTPAVAQRGRDVAATNSLAAAANAIHETEIAQARREARQEAKNEKGGKGKRAAEHVDSDFDERPKKTTGKGAKGKATAQPPLAGLGITNGEPVKKRRVVDKGLAAPAMERSASANTGGKGAKATRETPRSAPVVEGVKKITKAKPAPPQAKKRAPASVQNSPALASSPLHSSFVPSSMEPPPGAKSQSARLRQDSSATNLRHEKLVDEDASRPTSAAGKANGNGEKSNGKRKPSADEQAQADNAQEVDVEKSTEVSTLKREETDAQDAERPVLSRTASSNGKGKDSRVGTPRDDAHDAPMARTRSTRSQRGNARDSSSSEPQIQYRDKNHKRAISNSHILKQLAPFNRSPDIDRHRHDDMDEDLESVDGNGMPSREEEPLQGRSSRSRPTSRPASRRNTQTNLPPPRSPTPAAPEEEEPEEEPEDTQMVDAEPEPVEEAAEPVPELEEDEESEHDPDDPNELKYCYCNRGSYGEMVACDNTNCAKEWFHIGCTELKESPGEDETWYCKDCRPLFGKKRGGNGKGKAGGRGGG
jgi:hypothetical protein